MENIIFTPAAVLDLLSQIDELSPYSISMEEYPGHIELVIGESVYKLPTNMVEEVEVDSDAVEDIEEINQTAYENFDDMSEYINSGIIKELLKTIAVGGLVRLTSKFLK